MNHILALCSVMFSFSITGAEMPAKPGYAIINRIPLAGDGGWDYCALDDATGRLFVSHELQVHVVDVATHAQVGIIANTNGVHGIAFAPEPHKAYISNGKDTSVSVVDGTTLALIKKVHVTGVNPDAIVYDPYSRCIFTFNGKSANATAIDVRSDQVVATIDLGGKPEFAASNGTGFLYDNIEDKGVVAVINTKSMQVEKKWPVAPAAEPCAMAIDNKDHRLFVGCRSKVLVVMDGSAGTVIASLPIGDHVDAVVFDPGSQLIFCSNGEGTVTVIQKSGKDSYAIKENITTAKGAKTMAYNPMNRHLYLPTAEYEAVPTAGNPNPRQSVKSGSFVVLEVAPVGK